jgi:hypothetical protein
LVANTECPEDLTKLLDVLGDTTAEDGTELFIEVASYNHKVSSLCLRIRQLLYSEHAENPTPLAMALLTEAKSVDAGCQMPAKVRWGREPSSLKDGACTSLDTMNLYRASRCKLHRFLVLLLCHIVPYAISPDDINCLETWHLDCQNTIRKMTNDILEAASIEPDKPIENLSSQNIRRWIDALRLIWPLTVVTRLSEALPEQRDKARETLLHIGRTLGIKQAWIEGIRPSYSQPP